MEGYYSSGQFAKLANVSVRTIRYYDKMNILKPSMLTPSGARLYTDSDLARLQQILLLKYLGFSLDEIKQMLVEDFDSQYLLTSLKIQQRLVRDRIEQMQLMVDAIANTADTIEKQHEIDWSSMLNLIHLTGMEKSLADQYRDAGNISARIRLHRDYSTNKQGWFPWIFEQCGIEKEPLRILELGCGDGMLWVENADRVNHDSKVVISDISEGMLRDARRNITTANPELNFEYVQLDAAYIPFAANSFDLVIANHVLFYCSDIDLALAEIRRVLTPGGRLVCSTYGSRHMKEITDLVQEFDGRMVLSAQALYERFGLENGSEALLRHFEAAECVRYDDSILINEAQPLLDYIMSCHGNQNQFLLDRYKDFRQFVSNKTKKGFRIPKDAGVFIAE